MTLNDIMALILHYFTKFGNFWVHCVKVYMYDVVAKEFAFAISSPDEFLVNTTSRFPILLPAQNMTLKMKFVAMQRQSYSQVLIAMTSAGILRNADCGMRKVVKG